MTCSRTTPATPTDWCRFTSSVRRPIWAVTGVNSRYRDPEKIKAIFGFLPANTVNPGAVYADQSDLYSVQKEAVGRGVRHLFIVWFDGLDWPTTLAAAIQDRQGL